MVRLPARRGAGPAGDEPFLLAGRLPRTPVVVGENRYDAGRVAVEQLQASVVVLDDGFQNRTIDKDLEILVVNGRVPWGSGRLFPRGTLREPLGAMERPPELVDKRVIPARVPDSETVEPPRAQVMGATAAAP